MKQTRVVIAALVAIVALPASAQAAETTVHISPASSTWATYDNDPTGGAEPSLGPAQPVCLNLASPPYCPDGASYWGQGGWGWSSPDLSPIPPTPWVWAKLDRETSPAELQDYYFARTVTIGAPTRGSCTSSPMTTHR